MGLESLANSKMYLLALEHIKHCLNEEEKRDLAEIEKIFSYYEEEKAIELVETWMSNKPHLLAPFAVELEKLGNLSGNAKLLLVSSFIKSTGSIVTAHHFTRHFDISPPT